MFSGIVKNIGEIQNITKKESSITLYIKSKTDLESYARFQLGDSIAVNGVCLTITSNEAGVMSFDVSSETLAHTNLSLLKVASLVNLEPALRLNDMLSGSLVSGHVDAIVKVASIDEEAEFLRVGVAIDEKFASYMVKKGSITLDGVNLTINDTASGVVYLMIIPHTIERTIIKDWQVGTKVNMEIDLIARYCLDKRKEYI